MIDTHCHIFNEYYDNIDEVIKSMGNNIIIVAGTNTNNNKEVIKLCDKYSNVYGTIGLHPEEIKGITEEDYKFIEKNLANNKIVGIGEIGLDYYWDKHNKEAQKEVFMRQIELAEKYNKAIVVHSRDAIDDTYEILKNHKELKKIIHCFSSSIEMAEKFIKINSLLGIGGVITFKNSVRLVDVVKNIDLKYLLLETDSPFLTPEPFRGKKNEPKNVYFVANKIAQIKFIDINEVLKVTTQNAISQFDLDI